MHLLALLLLLSVFAFVDAGASSWSQLSAIGRTQAAQRNGLARRANLADCASECTGAINEWGRADLNNCTNTDDECKCDATVWFRSSCILCLAELSTADQLTQYYQTCNLIPDTITSLASCAPVCNLYQAELSVIAACGPDDTECICNGFYEVSPSCINCQLIAGGNNQQGNAADLIFGCQQRYPIPVDEPSGTSTSRSSTRTTAPISTTTTSPISTRTPVVGPPIPTPTTESSTRPVSPTPVNTNTQDNSALPAQSRNGVLVAFTFLSIVLTIALCV